jgi:ADP-ribose pyrophosphatase YjhB (NUDIX family)
MLSLELSAWGVLLENGQLLLYAAGTQESAPIYSVPGDRIALGTTQSRFIESFLAKQLGCTVSAGKLLYIVERFFSRGREQVHSIATYFHCQAEEPVAEILGESAARDSGEGGLVLLARGKLADMPFEPEPLRQVLLADAADEFRVRPKLVVVNEQADSVSAVSGVYSL